jgi:hypothetical protein
MVTKTWVDKIKDNMASISGIAATIGVIIGGWLVVDDRYAHAQMVKQVQSEQAQQIKQLRIENTRKFYRTRIADLDQRKFEIQVKPNQTNTDKLFVQRYDTQITELKKEEVQEIRSIEKE